MSKTLITILLLFTTATQASATQLELSCSVIPLDYPGFSLDNIQESAITLDASGTAVMPLFNVKDHTFIVGVNRTDITDQPVILDFYLQIQPPAPAAPVRAYSASYFSPATGKHHARLELLHYADKAEPYPSGQLVFECWQYE
ncbi:hypothetical protein WG68_13475 [Arsukibacterium ikkense]|uniref:Uncharacterized protein n=1 Tax=Arsukibacterium ikkense TaxID=336831 RepID=A0A0M2V2J6_9GAMM|nr:hypothetical protein [Arsukibacterium ikkense]KKO44841.1 hypothetical protein WG68_13475 [Arsukibacterium ikkense]